MSKEGKLKTPDWILEGYDSPAVYAKAHRQKEKEPEKEKGKKYRIKICPKCSSHDVAITLSNMDFEEESNTGKQWECKKCKWKGDEIKEKILSEDEFLKHMGKHGGKE